MKISITLNRIFKPISILVTDFFLQKATKTPFIPIHHDPVHNHPVHFSLPFQALFPSFNTNKKANVSETHVHTDLWTKSPPPSYRHWKHGKVYPCLQNNRNARNRCPSTPVNRRGNRGGSGASWRFFPTRRVRTSESASKLSCIRWGRRTPGGDHVRAVLQCPIGTSRGVAGRAFDRSLFGNTRNYKMPIPMVEG